MLEDIKGIDRSANTLNFENRKIKGHQTITRRELARAVSLACKQLSIGQSAAIVDEVLEEIADALVQGESVTLCNFGKFVIVSKKERKGRNPRTGESAVISSRRVVNFRASRQLKAILIPESAAIGADDAPAKRSGDPRRDSEIRVPDFEMASLAVVGAKHASHSVKPRP
jgi:integration host factor subunit alpha